LTKIFVIKTNLIFNFNNINQFIYDNLNTSYNQYIISKMAKWHRRRDKNGHRIFWHTRLVICWMVYI